MVYDCMILYDWVYHKFENLAHCMITVHFCRIVNPQLFWSLWTQLCIPTLICIQHYVMLCYYIILYYILLQYSIVQYSIVQYSIVCYIIFYYTILYYAILLCQYMWYIITTTYNIIQEIFVHKGPLNKSPLDFQPGWCFVPGNTVNVRATERYVGAWIRTGSTSLLPFRQWRCGSNVRSANSPGYLNWST